MTLPSIPRRETVSAEELAVGDWIGVARMLEEICRGLASGLGVIGTTVDCTPGLEVPGAERNRLARAVARLLVRTATGIDSGGLEVVARPTGSPAAPGLMFSVIALSGERWTSRGSLGIDADELTLTRELVERGGGLVLVSRQLPGERRATLGLDLRWRIGRGTSLRAVPAPATPLQVSAESSEPPPRYAAAEMPYSLSRW